MWQLSDKVVGKGTFGEVYVGLAADGSLVAIKMIALPQLQTIQDTPTRALPKEVEDLVSEVGMLAQIRHENVTGYLSSALVRGPSGFSLAIIMEYISGGSLSRLVGTFGVISTSCVTRYVSCILKGLIFLHSKDILHRDISPNNILLTIDGHCKLSDFGCASSLQRLKGGVAGTPSFMAPETCRGEPCKASDIWSLGILTYYMLTGGAVPYPVEDMQPVETFVRRLGADDVHPNFSLHSPIPQVAMLFIDQCCLKASAARSSAEQLLKHPFIIG